MTQEDKDQLFSEIDNQGFEYWLVNYASGSEELKKNPKLYDLALKAAAAITEVEEAFIDEGILE